MVLPQTPLPSLWRCRLRLSPQPYCPSRPERPLQLQRHREQILRPLFPRLAYHQEAASLSHLKPCRVHGQLAIHRYRKAWPAHPSTHEARPQYGRRQHGSLRRRHGLEYLLNSFSLPNLQSPNHFTHDTNNRTQSTLPYPTTEITVNRRNFGGVPGLFHLVLFTFLRL